MVKLKVIPENTQLAKCCLSSSLGTWWVVWSDEGIVRTTTTNDERFRSIQESNPPDWLKCAWRDFWNGHKVDVVFCAYKKPQPFTMKVYETVYSIPFGSTLTYKEVACLAGNVRASRAVGTIMRSNPWALFVPCHRVVGSDGSMRGYGGPEGIELKKALLAFERTLRLDN